MPHRLSAAVVAALIASLPPAPHAHAQPAGEWKQTWADEFDGTVIDPAKWDFDLGNGFFNYDANQWIGGWGNNELQHYTKEPTNAFVKDGVLHVRAVKESYQGSGYTSARLRSKKRDGTKLFAQRYGKFEFKAKLPTGKGVWPALWMLPQDETYGPWPTSGEIDVMEARGQEPTKVLGTLHYGSRWPANVHAGKEYVFPAGQSIAEWHTYAVEWEPGEIRWAVDGKVYGSLDFWWSSAKTGGNKGVAPAGEADVLPWPAPFDQPFYVVMNVAVGGQFLGNPDRTTAFPAEMLVEYVRAYEKAGGYAAPRPRGMGRFPFTK